MDTFLPILALGGLLVVLLGGLILVPIGMPGLWVMLAGGLLYWMLIPAGGIGMWTLGGAAVLVFAAEVLEFTISGRYTRRYGGSRRASWGAILGGLAGAVVGVPVPVIGSVLAAFAGAFVGAYIGERTVHVERRNDPARVATGALLGRAVAAAVKSGLGVVVASWLFAAALFGRAATS
jgi:uncharacterized protein YqgC (DUF456 family)